jgi:hypothetical protein
VISRNNSMYDTEVVIPRTRMMTTALDLDPVGATRPLPLDVAVVDAVVHDLATAEEMKMTKRIIAGALVLAQSTVADLALAPSMMVAGLVPADVIPTAVIFSVDVIVMTGVVLMAAVIHMGVVEGLEAGAHTDSSVLHYRL